MSARKSSPLLVKCERSTEKCAAPDCDKFALGGSFRNIAGLNICDSHAVRVDNAIHWYWADRLRNAPGAIPKKPAQTHKVEGWIYYLQIENRIKIGFTKNLYKRMVAYPPETKLLAAHPGTRQDETHLHTLFQSYCLSGREWYGIFRPITDHIAAMVEQHGEPGELAGARALLETRLKPVIVRSRMKYAKSRR